ncbi:MAG: AI-2E family transporter [Proteobacteria bacterium]|nr:AI-2E family transporter [Pseudomonadota bacterium]
MQSPFYQRTFQLAVAAVLGLCLFQILNPLRGMLGWAMVLAFILHPLHERLTRRLRGRESLSAGLLTGLTPFVVLAPLSMLGVIFAGQVARLVEYARRNSDQLPSYPELLDRLSRYRLTSSAVGWLREHATLSAAQVQDWVTSSLQGMLKSAAAMGGDVALGVVGTLAGFFIVLFMLYFFLKDGREILDSLTPLLPLESERRTRLLQYLADVTRAVVFGSVGTAVFQGVLTGIGFALVGLPAAVVFAVLATISALLPAGTALVTVPAVLYLFFTGRWGAAIFLGIWAAAVGVADNFVRPFLTRRHAEVSTLAIFIGAIGGVAAFGILGLVIGPVLLSFVVALVRFADEDSRRST